MQVSLLNYIGLRPGHAWFLKIASICCLYACVHASACASTPEDTINYIVAGCGMIWMPYDCLNKLYSFCIAAVVGTSLVGVASALMCIVETKPNIS